MHSAGFLFLKKTELPLSLFVNVYMAMLLINWDEATAADLSGFTVDLLCEELGWHQLEVTGSKADTVNHLLAHIAEHRPTPLHELSDATCFAPATLAGASPAMPAFTTDPVENV